ncbi:MAG: glutathione peroxidase [Bacteroidetes bacterium]|nr:glutathione peroxidase [Bacteroidota bacterium]
MLRITSFILILFLISNNGNAQGQQNFHSFSGVTILGDTISFSQWYGKKLLVVNTASFCGFTPQFAALQALDSTYDANNFEVIGFPCNDFGAQDPGEDSTILNFCTGVFGVKFQMMSKAGIALPDTAPWYKWLQWQYLNGVADAQVSWNFHKFCIDEVGNWVAHHPSTTLPFDTAIVNWILTPPVNLSLQELNPFFDVKINSIDNAGQIILDINSANNHEAKISLIDMSGRVLNTDDYFISRGVSTIKINASIKSRLFLIMVTTNQNAKVLKAVRF